MALVLNFEICQTADCKTFTFTETTGVYNASTNPTGWGAPNPLTSNATSATLAINIAGGTVYTLNLFTSSFPSSVSSLEYDVTASLIGGASGAKITDGIYTFVYTVVASGVTYTQTIIKGIYCQVQCCVYSMFKSLVSTCDCNATEKERALDAFILLKGLITSTASGNTTNFNTDLAVLQKMCLNSNCTNCE